MQGEVDRAVLSHQIEALISEFRRYGVRRGDRAYFCRRTSLDIVDRCENSALRILDIDGYYLTAHSIEQPIEWILDLSGKTNSSAYEVTRTFLQDGAKLPLFYEFVLVESARVC
jgi:hypothetical protein